MVHVIDSTALHRALVAAGDANLGALMTILGDSIANGEICFGKATIASLRQLSPDGPHTAWAVQAANGMWHTEPNWQDLQQITITLEDYIDFDELEHDPEMPSVLAIASILANEDRDVVVVTEDDIEKPDMISTTQACEILGFEFADLADCCATLNASHLLL